jgi:hypothetical protein
VVALLALLLQLVAIKAPLGDTDSLRRVLMVDSYILLLWFVAANINRPGIAIIGIGLILNFAAILANGGMMAIAPETILRTGQLPADAVVGEWLPGTKDVLLERSDIRLWFLTDRLVWDPISGVVRAFSVGDLVIAAGLVVTLVDLFGPRVRRVPSTLPAGEAPASP